MSEENRNKTKADEAWKRLYARLDKDNLLTTAHSNTSGIGRSRLRQAMLVAAVLVGCIYMVSLFRPAQEDRQPNLLVQENREASTLVTTLEDGSVVYLAQESSLQYPEHFAADKRQVNLEGEAFFDVARKQAQSFLIETEEVQVEVLGTAFSVSSGKERPFTLSVQRGRVKVSLKRNGHTVLVNAGETVTVQTHQLCLADNGRADVLQHFTRNMRFKDEPLENILRVVNSGKSSLQIHLASPALAKHKLTIEFMDHSPEMAAELISCALGLKCIRKAGELILTE